jgi:hypothetical protein
MHMCIGNPEISLILYLDYEISDFPHLNVESTAMLNIITQLIMRTIIPGVLITCFAGLYAFSNKRGNPIEFSRHNNEARNANADTAFNDFKSTPNE